MNTEQEPVTFANGRASAPLPISQIAVVVRDIDDALEKYTRVLGWGPWNVYEHRPPSLHDTYVHGEPTDYTMIGAEAHVGPIVVELLQPVEGPSIYKEWLEEPARVCITSRSCVPRRRSPKRRERTSRSSTRPF